MASITSNKYSRFEKFIFYFYQFIKNDFEKENYCFCKFAKNLKTKMIYLINNKKNVSYIRSLEYNKKKN